MTVETMRDILMELFPGRTISVDQAAWFQNCSNETYSNYACSIFKLMHEPALPDGGTIVCRVETKDIRQTFIETCKKMFEYEAGLAKTK